MTVQELINILEKLPNKDLNVSFHQNQFIKKSFLNVTEVCLIEHPYLKTHIILLGN